MTNIIILYNEIKKLNEIRFLKNTLQREYFIITAEDPNLSLNSISIK